jgi:uncharacterized protein YqhQ
LAPSTDHSYGGQAVIEGVMMRGRDHWAVAVRRPDSSIHLESHDIRTVGNRLPFLRRPGFRGVLALGQALSIGVRALTISANQAAADDERLTPRQVALSMAVALVVFAGVFVVGPFLGFRLLGGSGSSGVTRSLAEGVGRVALFVGYLALVGRVKDVRRVFEYHGAEHKTIAGYEHGDELEPSAVDRYSTLHVRCGTNFLLIVMLLTVLVYAAFGGRGLLWGIALRILTIPLIAGFSYELLRVGARFPRSPIVWPAMAPGLWLQRITTRPPHPDQIEVAIASLREVLRREGLGQTPPGRPGDHG